MRILLAGIIFLASLVGIVVATVAILFVTTPRPTKIKECFKTSLYGVDLCPTSGNYVRLPQISKHLQKAILLSEDSNFYNHNGFDWQELRESLQANLDQGKYVRGGSTLTQQLAKNLYLSKEKSLLRKVREAILVVQIEKTLTKPEILEKYLNVVEFGPNTYGVKRAAQFYFSKSPADLSPLESAWLAFLLPSPKKYSISFHKKKLTGFAHNQIKIILTRMQKVNHITEPELELALAQLPNLFSPEPVADTFPTDKDFQNPEELQSGPEDDEAELAL